GAQEAAGLTPRRAAVVRGAPSRRGFRVEVAARNERAISGFGKQSPRDRDLPMFLRQDLDELVTAERRPAVSIYLPTHVAGREIRQDPIRLRNLVSLADERLAKKWRSTEREALLLPARALVDDDFFWRRQESGLAIFLAPGFSRVHKLPEAVPEQVAVGDHFHILPLVGLVDAGQFWLLTLSASRTRLYQGTRRTFAEVAGLDLPQGVGEVRGETEYQQTYHAPPVGRRGTLAWGQSIGEDPDDVRKTGLIVLLRRVAAAVEPAVKRSPAPVVLAAHPEIRGHFRDIARWSEIIQGGISENPDALPEPELHRRAWACVEPIVTAARRAALDRLNAMLGTGLAATAPEDIVDAARQGRIDTLFVGQDAHIWGRIDEAGGEIVVHETAAEEDIDLLDYAALIALRNGGSVAPFERAALPPPGLAAALLRY
ncbi:MAG TPA: hypothetical protein VJ770_07690, partial [Stellaceae bacterium]|nr:hypothetical protein [Stellaceae bacterium]